MVYDIKEELGINFFRFTKDRQCRKTNGQKELLQSKGGRVVYFESPKNFSDIDSLIPVLDHDTKVATNLKRSRAQ